MSVSGETEVKAVLLAMESWETNHFVEQVLKLSGSFNL